MTLRVPVAFALSEDPEDNVTISFVVPNDDTIEPTTQRMSKNTTLGQIVLYMNETYGIEVEFVIYQGAEIYPSNPYGTKIGTIVDNNSGTFFFVKDTDDGRAPEDIHSVHSATPRSPTSAKTPLMFDMSPFSDRSDSSSSYIPPQKVWATNVLRRNNSSDSTPRSPFFPPLKRGAPAFGGPSRRVAKKYNKKRKTSKRRTSKRKTNKRKTSKRRSK